MTHILSKGAVACALVALAFVGRAQAEGPVTVPGIEVVDHSDRSGYAPDVWYGGHDNGPVYDQHYGSGGDEVRELQRAFPETNWPPSMRD